MRDRRAKTDREAAIRRYLELRPVVRARLTATVPVDLHEEFESITAHQLRALLLLPDEGLSMRQLALELGVMSATVSVLADRLVAQGLAVRLDDPSDRRIVRLAPSERGRALADRAAAQQRRSAAEMFDRLSGSQVAAFLDVLESLAAWTPGSRDEPADQADRAARARPTSPATAGGTGGRKLTSRRPRPEPATLEAR